MNKIINFANGYQKKKKKSNAITQLERRTSPDEIKKHWTTMRSVSMPLLERHTSPNEVHC